MHKLILSGPSLDPTKMVFRPQEVAQLIGISRQGIYERVRNGTIRSVRLDGKRGSYLIPRAEVCRLLALEENEG